MTADAKETPKKTPVKAKPTNKPTAKANSSTKQEVTLPSFKQKTSKIGMLAFLLALITAGGVATLGWLGYQQLETINQQLATTANEEKIAQAVSGLAKLTDVKQGYQHQEEALNKLEEQLTEHFTYLESLNHELAAINLPQLNLRQLTEVEFLLQRAEIYSQQLKEPLAAIQLVELALDSIKKINLSHKSKLIAQLETDLNQLTSQATYSRQSLAKELHLLAEKTQQLSSYEATSTNKQQTEAENLEEDAWYNLAWQELKNLIVIKELNQELKILPFSPEEEAIKQQLNALLLQAATAANLGQEELYLSCLDAAEIRLNLFTSSSQTKQLLEDLALLKQQDLNPQLASVNASLNELAKLQASINYQPED